MLTRPNVKTMLSMIDSKRESEFYLRFFQLLGAGTVSPEDMSKIKIQILGKVLTASQPSRMQTNIFFTLLLSGAEIPANVINSAHKNFQIVYKLYHDRLGAPQVNLPNARARLMFATALFAQHNKLAPWYKNAAQLMSDAQKAENRSYLTGSRTVVPLTPLFPNWAMIISKMGNLPAFAWAISFIAAGAATATTATGDPYLHGIKTFFGTQLGGAVVREINDRIELAAYNNRVEQILPGQRPRS